MKQLVWGDEFVVGEARIDAEHQEVFAAYNVACVALEAGKPLDLAKMNFYRRVIDHFRDEEVLMQSFQLDETLIEIHRREHRTFLESLSLMSKTADQEFLNFLYYWLTSHIKEHDKKMLPSRASVAG